MEGGGELKVGQQKCNNEKWESYREQKRNDNTAKQSGGFDRSSLNEKNVHKRKVFSNEMWRQNDNQSVMSQYSRFSRISSLLSERSFVSSATTVMGPLAARMSVIDVGQDGTNFTKFGRNNGRKTTSNAAFESNDVANVTGSLRKRGVSSVYCHGSITRPLTQERKRFASDMADKTTTFNCARLDPSITLASFALEAHNLPRYIPEENKMDFTRWLDPDRELVLYKVKDVATGLVMSPLGCTYDSALDTFVFTGPDRVLFASSDGKILDNLTLKGFQMPYAVCIIRPGEAMGILDCSKLYLYESKLTRLSVIASGLNGRHRALSYTKDGNLVTVRRAGTQLHIVVFDATEYNTVIQSVPYPYADGMPLTIIRQPCFADSVEDQIFFTDLRTNTLTCMAYTENNVEKVYSCCIRQKPANGGDNSPDRFLYMSGIRCDGFGHLLVADARARLLKLLSWTGQFLKCVRVADGATFPYCSSFGVSSTGFLMACDRRNDRMILYRFGQEPDERGVTNKLAVPRQKFLSGV